MRLQTTDYEHVEKKQKIKDALIDWLTYRKKKVREAEAERDEAVQELEKYKQRFRKIGAADVHTSANMPVQVIELEPKIYGNYFQVTDDNLLNGEMLQYLKGELAKTLAEGLLNEDMVKYIIKESNNYGPLEKFGTIGAKLYVIPWEDISVFKPLHMMRFAGDYEEERVNT